MKTLRIVIISEWCIIFFSSLPLELADWQHFENLFVKLWHSTLTAAARFNFSKRKMMNRKKCLGIPGTEGFTF